MANDDFDWDEVLVTNKPDTKEVEVSFKRVDGEGFFDTPPGTPPGAEETPDGCKNTVRFQSNDTFIYRDGELHYIWLVFSSVPADYLEVDLEFTDGSITYPGYTTQTLTVEINPGSYENDGTGFIGKKVSLSLGDVDDNLTTGFYNGEIVAVRGFSDGDNTPCFLPGTTPINFGDTAVEVPPNPEEEGGPLPGNNPECDPSDCGASLSALPGSTVDGNESYGGLFIWNDVDHPLATDRQYLTLETVSVPGTNYTDSFNYFRDNVGKLIPLVTNANYKETINAALWPAFANWGSGTDVLCTEPGAPFAADQNGNVGTTSGIYPASTILDPWNLTYDAQESVLWENVVATNDWANWPYYVFGGASSGGNDSWTNWFTPKTAMGPDDFIVYTIRAPKVGISWRNQWPDFANGSASQMAGKFEALLLFFGDGSIHTYESGPASSGSWIYDYSQSGRLKVFQNAWDPTGITKVKVAGSFNQNVTGRTLASGLNSSFQSGFGLTFTINNTTSSYLSFKATNNSLPQTPNFVPGVPGGVGFLKDQHPLSPFGTLARERAMLETYTSSGLIPLAAYGGRQGTATRTQPFGRVAMAYSPTQEEAEAIERAIDKAFVSYTPPTYCDRIT